VRAFKLDCPCVRTQEWYCDLDFGPIVSRVVLIARCSGSSEAVSSHFATTSVLHGSQSHAVARGTQPKV
jgi:hypothetical protein